MTPFKRSRSDDASAGRNSPESLQQSPEWVASTAVAFRNVSACHRCRQRKNKCDHRLPSCAACEKANVHCVGYDLTTRREVPRSYVFYLETRVSHLESILKEHDLSFEPPSNLSLSSTPGSYPIGTFSPLRAGFQDFRIHESNDADSPASRTSLQRNHQSSESIRQDKDDLRRFKASVDQIPEECASNKRFLGSAQGITFARLVIACLRDKKNSIDTSAQPGGAVQKSGPVRNNTGTSMRDAFFGLHNKPNFRPAEFPEKQLALKLINLYMEYANPQLPILHREEFISMVEEVYALPAEQHTPKQKYFLNIVFAIGAGIILGGSDIHNAAQAASGDQQDLGPANDRDEQSAKRRRTNTHQHQPEEYYASAMHYLEPLLSSDRGEEGNDTFGGLEELQAVLLLAAYALLRPTTPGLWYIVGVGTRLAKDLGLHYEHEEPDLDRLTEISETGEMLNLNAVTPDQGRREYIRDMRRRLWWCAYSFDRLVSICVGRPVGISDDNILCKFPSLVEDQFIRPTGILRHSQEANTPSYKRISHHYFRLRILQTEILDVLLQRNIIRMEAAHPSLKNPHLHSRMKWQHLADPDAFGAWRNNMDRRLKEWKDTAPGNTEDTSVGFALEFFALNYWQAVMMLYRQNLNIPIEYGGDLGSPDDNQSGSAPLAEEFDPYDAIPIKIVEAARNILHLYRQLHRRRLVNWTYLATHAIFITAVSLLYAVWHSEAVRRIIPSNEMKSCVDDGILVLDDLAPMCPPAADLKVKLHTLHRAVHWQYAIWLKNELDERQRARTAAPEQYADQRGMTAHNQFGANQGFGRPNFGGHALNVADRSSATSPRSSLFSPSTATTRSFNTAPSPTYNFVRPKAEPVAPFQSRYPNTMPNYAVQRSQMQQQPSVVGDYPNYTSDPQSATARPTLTSPTGTFGYGYQPVSSGVYPVFDNSIFQQAGQLPVAFDSDADIINELDLGLGQNFEGFTDANGNKVQNGNMASVDQSSGAAGIAQPFIVDYDGSDQLEGNEHMNGFDMGNFVKLGHDMGSQGMPIRGQFFHPEFEGFFFGGNSLNGTNGTDNGAGYENNSNSGGVAGDEYQGGYRN